MMLTKETKNSPLTDKSILRKQSNTLKINVEKKPSIYSDSYYLNAISG